MTRPDSSDEHSTTNRRAVLRGLGVAASGGLLAAGSAAATDVRVSEQAAGLPSGALADAQSRTLLGATGLRASALQQGRSKVQWVRGEDVSASVFRVPVSGREAFFAWSPNADLDLLPAVVEFDRSDLSGSVLSYRTLSDGEVVELSEADLDLASSPHWDVCPDFDADCAASIALATAAGSLSSPLAGFLAGASAAYQCEMC